MIKFTPDLETNVPHIDEQHRELFKRINSVVALGERSVSKEETDETLNLLGAYIHKHFGDEEELQRKSGYPKYEWHCGQHRQYVESFGQIKAEYEKNGPSLDFTLRLNKSIIDWIIKHIRSADRELGIFINEKT